MSRETSRSGGKSVDDRTASPLFPRYLEPSLLSEGGQACVYEATDPRLKRPVALKTIHSDRNQTPDARDAFRSEIEILGSLEHPNIVPIYDADRTLEGSPFFSMKRIEGKPLSEVLRSLSPRTHNGERFLIQFHRICDAVAYAHARGIGHRDLKPDNILIGRYGEVYVTDWGLATSIPVSHGQAVGTPGAMAPEQVDGHFDTRSDIYSLGVILYQILTLLPPLTGSSTTEIIAQGVTGDFLPPRERAPHCHIPREIEAVVLKAMSTDPEQRYQRVLDLQADIRAHLEGRTLSAALYSPLQIATKWAGRHRKELGAGLLATLFVILLSVGSSWVQHRHEVTHIQRSLSQARERIEWAGALDKILLISPEDEIPLTPEQQSKAQKQISHLLVATANLEEALRVNPTDDRNEELRRQVIEAIGLLALQSGKYLLARQIFGELRTTPAARPRIDKLLALVTTLEHSARNKRKTRLEMILQELDRGLYRPNRPPGAPLLEDFLFQAMQYLDIDSVHILGADLQRLTERQKPDPTRVLWTQEERDRATFICRLFGRLAQPECLDLLIPWITPLQDPQLLIEAGKALCNTRLYAARNTLLTLRQRIGEESFAWKEIKPYLSRISSTPEAKTSLKSLEAIEEDLFR